MWQQFQTAGLGLHNYHAAYNRLPQQGGGTNGGGGTNNGLFLSILVPMLPFVEQQSLWEQISNPLGTYPAMGPVPGILPMHHGEPLLELTAAQAILLRQHRQSGHQQLRRLYRRRYCVDRPRRNQ